MRPAQECRPVSEAVVQGESPPVVRQEATRGAITISYRLFEARKFPQWRTQQVTEVHHRRAAESKLPVDHGRDARAAFIDTDQDVGSAKIRVRKTRGARPACTQVRLAFSKRHQRLSKFRTEALLAARAQQGFQELGKPPPDAGWERHYV